MTEIQNSTAFCSECFNIVTHNPKTYIRHKEWGYCGVECLQYRLNLDITMEWIMFKNSIDIYDNEEPLGSHTLIA